MSLKKFIAQENNFRKVFPAMGAQFSENPKHLSADDKRELAERISSALSPECLSCDGELRGAKLLAKAKSLNAAKQELEAMGVVVPAY